MSGGRIMVDFTVFALGESNISVSGGQQLSGITQGDGSHLLGETITLNSNAFEAIEIRDNDFNFADNDNSQRLDGAQTFDGVNFANNLRVEAEFQLTVEDPDGNQFILQAFNINEPGVVSFSTIEGLAFVGDVGGFPPIGVPLTVTNATEGPSVAFASLASPPCFTAGTLVATTEGLVEVQDLQPGHVVQTLDNGLQPLIWTGQAHVPNAVLCNDSRFLPVLVKKDAFGPGQPERDMRLSQQHRVLVRGWQVELFYGQFEVLVPVAKLINGTTITMDRQAQQVTYVHLLFERHELIWADGLLSESFLPSVENVSPTQQEILRLFPDLSAPEEKPKTARTCVQDKRTALLLQPPEFNSTPARKVA